MKKRKTDEHQDDKILKYFKSFYQLLFGNDDGNSGDSTGAVSPGSDGTIERCGSDQSDYESEIQAQIIDRPKESRDEKSGDSKLAIQNAASKNSDDENSDIQFLGTTYLNRNNDKVALNNIFGTLPQTNTMQRVRSISIDIHAKDDSTDKFTEKTLKRKRLENAGASHRLSSVTKKRNATKRIAMSGMKEKYCFSYLDAAKKGFKGDENSYNNLHMYIKQVREYELKELSNYSISRSGTKTRESLLFPSTSQIEAKVPDTPKPSSSTTGDSKNATDWLHQLRSTINAALSKPTPSLSVISPIETKEYDRIIRNEKELEKKIKSIELEPLVEKKTIPHEEHLFPPLTNEMISLFNEMCRGPDDEEIIKAFAIPITKKDMRTLQGCNWLNDEIINFYGELCMARAKALPDKYPNIHIFNTFFYEKLKTTGYSGVRRWSKKFDVFALDYIIIPVHMGMHWCCSVINFKKKRFEYYDSLHGKNLKCVGLLREYLEQESLDKKKTPFDTSDWIDYIPNTCPHQENGHDCGVFTCMFMEFTAREMDFVFGQKHMPYLRKRIAWEIKNVKLIWY